MPEDTGLLHRRARERVLNDGALVGDIATRVARALHLEGNNRTLGRKIVGLALSELQKAPADAADAARDAAALAAFALATRSFAQLPGDVVEEALHSVSRNATSRGQAYG